MLDRSSVHCGPFSKQKNASQNRQQPGALAHHNHHLEYIFVVILSVYDTKERLLICIDSDWDPPNPPPWGGRAWGPSSHKGEN